MDRHITIPDELYERFEADPKGSKKIMVILKIRRRMNYKTGYAWISPEQFAKDFREKISENFIRDLLTELEDIGYIVKYGVQRGEEKGTHLVFADIRTPENETEWERVKTRKAELAQAKKKGTQKGTRKTSKNAGLSEEPGTRKGTTSESIFNQKRGGLSDVDNSGTGVRVDKSDHEGTKSEEFSPGAVPDPGETDGKAERMLRELHQLRAKRRGETA